MVGRFLGNVGARLAIVGLLAGGFALYRGFVSADRDDSGAITESGDVAADELAVGDCINWPDPNEEIFEEVTGIPCTEPHDAEVYAVTLLRAGDDDPYPGYDGFVDEAAESCIDAFEGYVGVAYEIDELHYFDFFSPTEEGWDIGDREIICLAYRIDEAKLTASIRGSA